MSGRARRPLSPAIDLGTRTTSGADRVARPARGRHAAGRRRREAVTLVRPPSPRAAAGTRASARRDPTPRRLVRSAGALVVALAGGLASAGSGQAQPIATAALARATYAPVAAGGWRNDTTLGRTPGTDQFAQAQVSGLTDGAHEAGFLLRYADHGSRVRVSVSGTGWRIEPSGQAALAGAFTAVRSTGGSGLLRVEAVGRTLSIRWNGTLVASRSIGGTFAGRHVVATVRQPRAGVVLRSLRAGTARTATPPPAAVGTAAPDRAPAAASARTWLSGASSDEAAAGTYGAWRGTPIRIGGTWDDSYDGQINQWTVCGDGVWGHWNAPLDLAFGGIYHARGETWAKAAKGAYDARWSAALTTIRRCWGTRDPGLLYLRFAHEMNLPGDWSVHHGEEASFLAAIGRFSTLRYRILPRAKVVLCPNDGTDGGLGGLDVRSLWPGRDSAGRRIADIYAVDSYNQWPHVTTAAQFASKILERYDNGMPLGLEQHRRFAASVGVPFAVSEWSNNGDPADPGGGGESTVYVQQFHAWAKAHAGDVAHPRAGQLLYEIQFNLWTQFAFWPTTRQPRTAAAYRALPWGR